MLIVSRGQSVQFKFIFISEGNIYDPTASSTPVDLYFSVIRGEYGSGPIIDGPYSYLIQEENPSGPTYIEKSNSKEFTFYYQIPDKLYEGIYSVIAQTTNSTGNLNISTKFQVKGEVSTLSPIVISPNKSTVVNYKPSYEQLNSNNTSTILLIGHANGIEFNNPINVRSMQSAIDLLGADLSSPLLRGVFDAYAAGARDIMICATAPMSEYVDKYSDRNTSNTLFDRNAATPSEYTFYERYYERLEETYSVIKDLDFIDIIVPLETSIIKTGGVDFITQLADYCADFHNTTGYVQIGVIGSRSGGVTSSDIDLLEANSVLTDKLTTINMTGQTSSDNGRFVIPVYGEAVYQHDQIKTSYVSSIAASLAGMFASRPLNMGLIRTRIPGAMSLYGADLSQSEYQRLDDIGVNTIYRGKKTRRSVPFEVYLTNEYTLSDPESTLHKAAQMRLVALLVSRIRGYGYKAIGQLGYDKVVDDVRSLLESLKSDKIIVTYSFNVEVSSTTVGSIIFYIEVLSALGLKKIDFALSTGPGV